MSAISKNDKSLDDLVLRADRALEPSQWIPVKQVFEPLDADHRLLGDIGEPFPEGGGLRRHVVSAGHHHLTGVLLGQPGKAGQ